VALLDNPENDNENSFSSPEVLYKGYNYLKVCNWTKDCEEDLKEKIKKKSMINDPISQG
jgi:hypothetical protein